MKTRRSKIAAGSVVILLLVGIGAFLAYDMNAPVQQVRVYQLPDTKTPLPQSETEAITPTSYYATEKTNIPTSNEANLSLDDSSTLQAERRIQELEAAAARNQLILNELREYKATAEAEKKAGQAMLAEAQDAANWISDWARRTESLYAEVAFILYDPSINNQEDFKRAFPDLDERAYYAEKLVEAEKATDEFAERLALLSGELRSAVLDGIRARWTPTAGKEAVDAFIEQVNDKI